MICGCWASIMVRAAVRIQLLPQDVARFMLVADQIS